MSNLAKFLISGISNIFTNAIFYQNTSEKVIALTIDDVPISNEENDISTEKLLTTVADYNHSHKSNIDYQINLTFFIITSYLNPKTNILKKMIDEGHEVANHGIFDHTHACLSPSEFQLEIEQANRLITQVTQTPIQWFRPGRGFYNQNMIETLKKMPSYQPKVALGSMIPLDTRNGLSHPDFTLKYIKPFIFPGAILILHGGTRERTQNTLTVLKALLPYLQTNGYRLVTLSNLIFNF